MQVVTYQCNVCNFVGSAGERVLYYCFADGERLPSHSLPVWCRKCNQLTSAESLPTAEQVITEIERLRSLHTSEFDLELAEMLNESLEEILASRLATLTKIYHRLQSRLSPNRCLECGTTAFEYLQDVNGKSPEHLPHPRCSGTLHRRDILIAIPSSYVTLDAEGNRISDSGIT